MIDQDDIIDFLRQNGGRVTNIELYVAFKGKIKNAEDKKQFPVLVNNVAFVKKKTENGEEIKYTYLRKQFKLDERKEDSLPKQIHDQQSVSASSSNSRIREEPLEPNQNTERKPDRDEREHFSNREDPRTKIIEQKRVQNQIQPNQRSVSPILRDTKAEKLDKHRKLIQESMSSHSSRESLNSRESKENTPRHSRESTPQHHIKDPEFKKPQPIGIKNNRKREEMGVLGHNNNSNIKSNNDLGGSCGSLSSNHSTGAESTGSRERSHIDATEKLWIHSIIKDDQKKVKELLEERLDLLEYRDYILGVSDKISSEICTQNYV